MLCHLKSNCKYTVKRENGPMFGQVLPQLENAFAEEILTHFFNVEGIFHIFV